MFLIEERMTMVNGVSMRDIRPKLIATAFTVKIESKLKAFIVCITIKVSVPLAIALQAIGNIIVSKTIQRYFVFLIGWFGVTESEVS